MSLSLSKVFDPRDKLEKARRKELERFAKKNGITEIRCGMPAPVMRKILRQKGFTNIQLPNTRFLGGPSDMATQNRAVLDTPPNAKIEETSALDLLEKEWEQSAPVFNADMDIRDLRKACKERGVKLARTDKREDMVRKLNGQDAS